MEKEKAHYAIYKFDFHKAAQQTIIGLAEGVESEKNVERAQTCFASLFDKNSIDNLAKTNKKGEITRLPNDVMAKSGGIFLWRVNNSQMKEWWRRNGKDNKGIDVYEKQDIESNPYCNVIIDNRPGMCLMAIEKSSAWNSKPDMLRDMLLENFNRILTDRYGLEMRIEARMNPVDIWQFVHERIYHHKDYIRKVSFSFQNPNKVNKSDSMTVKSDNVKAMIKTVEISNALKGFFTMEFDKNNEESFSQKNKDMAEMVRLCSENGYDISITFKEYKTYRINDYVRASYPMEHDIIEQFQIGSVMFNGKTELELWFDNIAKETKDYANESEISTEGYRQNKSIAC